MSLKNVSMSLEAFARDVLGRKLHDYQLEIGEAILDSIKNNLGLTFTVMLGRQMGKNQLSAVLEAYLLWAYKDDEEHKDASIVKVAPTFHPQVITSRMRLLSLLQDSRFARHVWKSEGYIIGFAPEPSLQGQPPQT